MFLTNLSVEKTFKYYYVALLLNKWVESILLQRISVFDKLPISPQWNSLCGVFNLWGVFYDYCFIFLKQIEGEYALLFQSNDDWESFHLKFLLYYLVRFRIKDEKDFIFCHFRAAYRLYLNHLLGNNLYFCY